MKKHKALLIEDDEKYAALLRDHLTNNNFIVDVIYDGLNAKKRLKNETYSLVVLDVMFPTIDGYDVCKAIREYDAMLPMIVINSVDSDMERIYALEMGADYYLCKPCNLRELTVSIQSLLRRASLFIKEIKEETEAKEMVFPFGLCTINTERRQITKNDKIIDCSYTEFEIILFFHQNPNLPLTREAILKHVRGRTFEIYDRSVDVHIGKVRRKIEPFPKRPRYILSERGLGYRYVPLGTKDLKESQYR
ncbi:MAG: response regulator transcription factor [Nitrospinae bacterium]|nr:response regulator transcription factor [Nitrospinota bacterium]